MTGRTLLHYNIIEKLGARNTADACAVHSAAAEVFPQRNSGILVILPVVSRLIPD